MPTFVRRSFATTPRDEEREGRDTPSLHVSGTLSAQIRKTHRDRRPDRRGRQWNKKRCQMTPRQGYSGGRLGRRVGKAVVFKGKPDDSRKEPCEATARPCGVQGTQSGSDLWV